MVARLERRSTPTPLPARNPLWNNSDFPSTVDDGGLGLPGRRRDGAPGLRRGAPTLGRRRRLWSAGLAPGARHADLDDLRGCRVQRVVEHRLAGSAPGEFDS